MQRVLGLAPRQGQLSTVQDAAQGLFLSALWRARRLICLGGCGAALFVYAVFATAAPATWIHVWGVFAAAFFALIYGCAARWVLDGMAAVPILRFMLLLGAVTLSLPLLLFHELEPVDRSMVSVILVVAPLGLVALTHGYRNVALWFAFPLLAALVVAWVGLYQKEANPSFMAHGLCVVLVGGACWGVGRQMDVAFRAGAVALQRHSSRSDELEQLVRVAEQASRSKTRFLASASHDLRQPLHTIGMLVGVLEKQVADPSVRPVVDILQTVNRSLADQLDSLLDLSKLDAGAVTPAVQVLRLDRLVAQHAQQLAPQLSERGLQLLVQCDEPVTVCSDPGLLLRLLGNLTSNAIKFTEVGQVVFGVKRINDQAVMWVQDTGPGIAEDMQQHVFAEFVQLGNHQRDITRGLGLGLAIVTRLCGLLGASVSLKSSVGRGARFDVSMPAHGLEPVPSVLPRVPLQTQPSTDFHQRILLVGEQSAMLQSTRTLLETAGHQVIVVGDARLALMHVRSGPVDVLMADLRLPGGQSGAELAIQTLREAPRVRTAVLAGDSLAHRDTKLKAAGVHVLHKPVIPQALLLWLDASAQAKSSG